MGKGSQQFPLLMNMSSQASLRENYSGTRSDRGSEANPVT